MTTRSFTATVNAQRPEGGFNVLASGASDVAGLVAAADTAAATATTDSAAAVTYAGTIGLTGSLVASVTLTAGQGNSLLAAMVLVDGDIATVKTDTAAAKSATTADVVVIVNTANAGTQSKLHHAFNAVVRAAAGSGFAQ